MAFRANIAYLAAEIATKVIESVQAKQERAVVSQNVVETKQLSPRLAGEWFDIPDTTSVCRHVAKKYVKFGAARLAVGAVVKEGRKALYSLVSCFPSRLWGFNMHRHA